MFTVTSTLTLGHLRKLTDDLADEAQKVCDHTALNIEHDAKEAAPVDTGFLRRSIYSDTSKGSDYPVEVAGKLMLPKLERPPGISALVAVSAPYGAPVDTGSVHGPAQPYFTPAVERNRHPMLDLMEQIFEV
jgi:hypothetical protein